MLKFVFSPEWFYGIDSIFEVFSIIVTLLIGFSAYKLYKFSGKRNYKFFSLAFFLFAFGFFFKILTNITIYSEILESKTVGFLTVITRTVTTNEIFFIIGYLLFRTLVLLGLLGIYMVSYKRTSPMDMWLFAFMIFIISVFSHYIFIVFHVTALFLLTYIYIFYHKNYKKRKNKQTLLVALSFLFMLLGQISFLVVQLNLGFYALGETLQLFGFGMLLATYILVLKK